MGIGSDLGGSCRAPATFCGIYGLKFSCARVSRKGMLESHDSMPGGMRNFIVIFCHSLFVLIQCRRALECSVEMITS